MALIASEPDLLVPSAFANVVSPSRSGSSPAMDIISGATSSVSDAFFEDEDTMIADSWLSRRELRYILTCLRLPALMLA